MGFFRGMIIMLKDFCCWSTTHAVPHIGMANRTILGVFWGVILLACIAGFIYQLRCLILKYLAYAVNTETKLEFSARPFPTVMICHLNPWKADSISSSPYLSQMLTAYNTASKANEFYGFAAGRTGERQQRAVRMTTLANAHLFSLVNNTQYMDPHYTYDDLVISCSYNVQACNATDWVPKKDPNFGMCYVYNVDGSKWSSRAGPLYGLRVVMRTNQANYLPWTEAAGIVVTITDHTDVPYPDVLGYFAPPGTATDMGVRYVKTTRKGAPYGTCRVSKTADFPHYKGKYETESCYRSCLQEQTIKRCGCYDPSYAYLGGATTQSCFLDGFDNSTWEATSGNQNCIDSMYDSSTTWNMVQDCTDCTPPCEVETFATTVSTAQWPSNEYKPGECTAYNQTGQPWLFYNESASETKCLAWYKVNTLLVEVYYERMNYQLLTESAAYTIVNLISDIGGQLGLFLGMSLISILEILVLGFLLCWYCATHGKRKQEMDEYERRVEEEKRKTAEFFAKNERVGSRLPPGNRVGPVNPREPRDPRDPRSHAKGGHKGRNSNERRHGGGGGGKGTHHSKPRRKGMSNAVYNPRSLSDAYRVPPVQEVDYLQRGF